MKTVYHYGTAYSIPDDATLNPSIYGPPQTQEEYDSEVAFQASRGVIAAVPPEVVDVASVQANLDGYSQEIIAKAVESETRAGLNVAFNALPAEVRVRNSILEMTVNRRLDSGDIEGAVMLLTATELHPDDEPLRAGFLAPLQAMLPPEPDPE